MNNPLGPLLGAAGAAVGGAVEGVGKAVGGVGAVTEGVGTAAAGLGATVQVLTAPPSPPPSPLVAEPGGSTSEAKAMAVKSILLGVFGLLGALNVFHVPVAVQAAIVGAVPVGLGLISAGYSLSRGLRKHGTGA